jgi:DNA topoisomerase-2
VNGISTYRGGKHVEHALHPLVSYIQEQVPKLAAKKKVAVEMDTKPGAIKGQLWVRREEIEGRDGGRPKRGLMLVAQVFINALIENPAFDSQTKEQLTSSPGTFGSKVEYPADFFKKSAP